VKVLIRDRPTALWIEFMTNAIKEPHGAQSALHGLLAVSVPKVTVGKVRIFNELRGDRPASY
jgi:hypothetical protein